jgi:AmpE protein
MATVFIAVLLVLLLTHFLPNSLALRNFAWLRHWQEQGSRQSSATLGIVLSIGLPVLFCLVVQLALHEVLFGLASLVFAVLVLFYCLGPRDLERDVEAVDKAPDSDRRGAAAQALKREEMAAPLPFEAEPLVEAAFDAALRRVFGTIFWFVLLGPVGALLYRLTQLLAYTPAHAQNLPAPQQMACEKLARVLDWAPAHLMVFALALASDFDTVFKTWRDYHASHGKGYFVLDLSFLNAIARASVDADVAAGDGHVVDVTNPLVALDDAMTLIRRSLIVWLAVLAVIVMAGWFA